MTTAANFWTPGTAILLWRISGLLLLAALWLSGQSGIAGVVLLLVLTIMSSARQRFALPAWTVLADQGACFAVVSLWPDAWYAVALPVFEALLAGRMRLVLPAALALTVQGHWTVPLLIVLIQSGLAGWAMRFWKSQLNESRSETDRERRDRHELELMKRELLTANVRTTRLAELGERNRIATELHDHAGHELTAALLALKAFEPMWKEGDPQATEWFGKAMERLEQGTRYLRETVHSIVPVTAVGVRRLEEICLTFTACPVQFQAFGDTGRIPVYQWMILEPCLKEALTNIGRHSQATRAEAVLDVGEHIVRLSVHDNGEGNSAGGFGIGIGLRNLRQRARAVGGSVTSDGSSGYQLVCVLPLEHGDQSRVDRIDFDPDH